MFGFGKKKRKGTPDGESTRGEPIIAMLLVEGDTYSNDAFSKQLAKARIGGHKATNIELSETVLSFELGDEFFALASMPAPYPADELEGPIETTWLWPPDPPIDEIKRHRSHLLVTMVGGAGTPVERRLALTAVTGLAAEQEGVMAVFWPDAALVIYPPVFSEMAEEITSPEAPPLYLWVDFRAFPNEDGTIGLFTCGLSALGHMEIEIPRIEMEVGELRDWLIHIICYLLENGPVLKDGDTIGTSEDQKILIRHAKSQFGHKDRVIRFEP